MTSSKNFEKTIVSDIDYLSSIIKLDEIYAIEGFYKASNIVIEQIAKKKVPSKNDKKKLRLINIIILISILLLFNSHQQNLLIQWFDEKEEKKWHREVIRTYLPNYTAFQVKSIVQMPQPPVELLQELTYKELNDMFQYYSKNYSNFVIFLSVLKDLKDRNQENDSQESLNEDLSANLKIVKKNIDICSAKVRKSHMNSMVQKKSIENISAEWKRKIDEPSVESISFNKNSNIDFSSDSNKEQSITHNVVDNIPFPTRHQGRKSQKKTNSLHYKYLPSVSTSKLQGKKNKLKRTFRKATI